MEYPNFTATCNSWGLTTLTKPAAHYGLSLILGGAEATLWEVTEGYRKLAGSLLPQAATTLHTEFKQGSRENEVKRSREHHSSAIR